MMKHSHRRFDSTRDIRVAFFLNLGFTLLEIIGGLWTNSMAIFSDALHDLGDSFSLGLSWYLDKYSKKEWINITRSDIVGFRSWGPLPTGS